MRKACLREARSTSLHPAPSFGEVAAEAAAQQPHRHGRSVHLPRAGRYTERGCLTGPLPPLLVCDTRPFPSVVPDRVRFQETYSSRRG